MTPTCCHGCAADNAAERRTKKRVPGTGNEILSSHWILNDDVVVELVPLFCPILRWRGSDARQSLKLSIQKAIQHEGDDMAQQSTAHEAMALAN